MATDRSVFWTLETLDEVKELAGRTFENRNSQRWVIWEWKRRRDGNPPRQNQPRQPRPPRPPRLTRDQRVINNFLMTTSVEEFTRLQNELLQQQQQPPQPAPEPEPEPQPEPEPEEEDEKCVRCSRPRDGEQNYFEDCGCFICEDCERNLFFENRFDDDEDVEIRCPTCREINTYDHDYFN